MLKTFVAIIICCCAVFGFYLLKTKTYAPGILIPAEPLQAPVQAETAVFEKSGFTLHPLVSYSIDARLLHKKRYYSDPGAAIAPFDFAVGWGSMSDQTVLDRLTISQGNRFFWQYQTAPPIPVNEIISHASNMHLIPASFRVRTQLWWVRAGDLVRLRGYLVEADAPGRPPWRSSLSRTDTGNGACELMWVESVQKL